MYCRSTYKTVQTHFTVVYIYRSHYFYLTLSPRIYQPLVGSCAQHVAVGRVAPLLDPQPLDLDREETSSTPDFGLSGEREFKS